MTQSRELSPDMEPAVLSSLDVPFGLADMRTPPPAVYLWGTLPPGPWVSIVGTRTPTPRGFWNAFSLARRLAKCGVTIVSGGALGIDSAAHLGALSGRGATVVVAPTWLDAAYPLQNHPLFSRILRSGGAYLTVAQRSTKPLKFAFFRRNEVMMALSHATVLGECPLRSGAKNAMQHARSLGRPRFVLPFAFNHEGGRGAWAEVVSEGAEILSNADPVLRLLEEYGTFDNPRWWEWLTQRAEGRSGKKGSSAPPDGPSRQAEKNLARGARSRTPFVRNSPEEGVATLIYGAVTKGALTPDQLCAATGLAAPVVQHQTLLLIMSGCLEEDESGLLRPAANRLPLAHSE